MTTETRSDVYTGLAIWLLLAACFLMSPDYWRSIVGVGLMLAAARLLQRAERPKG